MRRAVRGANLAIMCPGGIYGPSPFVERAIHPSQWNGAMLRGIRGELTRYAKYPFTWPFIEDSAKIALGALDNDRVGARYLSVGRPEDSMSLAELINIACELAGSPHRVEDITPEQLEKEVGTMSVIFKRKIVYPQVDPSETNREIGIELTPVQVGVERTVAWMRDNKLI